VFTARNGAGFSTHERGRARKVDTVLLEAATQSVSNSRSLNLPHDEQSPFPHQGRVARSGPRADRTHDRDTPEPGVTSQLWCEAFNLGIKSASKTDRDTSRFHQDWLGFFPAGLDFVLATGFLKNKLFYYRLLASISTPSRLSRSATFSLAQPGMNRPLMLTCISMNFPLVSKCLGIVALLVGASMALCLPWAFPAFSHTPRIEWHAIVALLAAANVAGLLGGGLLFVGRRGNGRMFRKEALAIVGLSWCLATVLGAVPFLMSGTCKGIVSSGQSTEPTKKVRMDIVDALFESASGFCGTGATVITDVEDSELVPRAILFWRSTTHFLGGLGIMVLFVALLGHSFNGKAVMRAELAGPSKDIGQTRVQYAAWAFASIYVGLNVVLVGLLLVQGMGLFDALCHSFGTIATGGFSTYNDSVGHFRSAGIEMTIVVFMGVSCINFALLYHALFVKLRSLFQDAEVRVYLFVLAASCVLTVAFGLYYGDFESFSAATRYGLFQVTSILTNTGFGTHDFNEWNEFGRGLLFVLMFVGGCAGSTSCSIKIIRHLILAKSLSVEIERTYRPNVVRQVRVNGEPVDSEVIRQVFIYFGAFLSISVVSWLLLIAFEPDTGWAGGQGNRHEKLMDCASAVAATINGVGPGLGTVGATRNYAHFQPASKLLLSLLMLLGRLEIAPVIVLLFPGFWRSGKW